MVVDCIMDFVRQLFGNTKTIRDKLNTEECLVPYDHALGCLYALLTTTSLPPLAYSTVCGLTVVCLARAQL